MATPSKKGGTESDQLLSEFNSTYDAITSMLESLKAGPGDTPPPPQQQQQQQQPQQQPQLPRAASAFGARSLQRRRSSAAEAPAATAVRPRTAAGFGGAPRALVDKIDMYRSSKEARRELAARLQAESGADAATTSGINRGINFIMANRACLSARGALAAAAPLAGSGGSGGDPFSGSMQDRSWDAVGSRSRRAADVAAAGAAPQQQRVAQASSAGGAGPPAPWAHYDATPPLPSGSSQLAIAVLGGGGGPSGCSTPVAGSGGAAGFRGGAATPGSARPATAGAGGAAGGYGAGSPPPGVGQLNVESAGGQSRLGPGSPTRNSGSSRPGTANASPSHTTSRPGTANASPSRPGTASGRPATGSRRPSFLERGASPFHGFTASFPSTPAGRLRPGSACPSPNAARRLTLEGWEAAGGGSTGGSNPDSPGDFRLEHKALRVVLTSRPAAGGSPTALPSFLEEQQYLVERRNEHGEEVRERYAKQTEDKIAQIAWSAGGRQRKAEEEAARRAANAEMVEIERRRNTWLGVTNVSAKLVFVVEQLIKDRAARPWRTIQKRAALTIAIWYKRVLLLRRQRQMVTLIMTLNRLMRNTAGGIRERVRSSSAHRIVALMQAMEKNRGNAAAVAVTKFLTNLRFVQSHWRVMLQVRRTQNAVLYSHALKFEKALVTKNKKPAGLALRSQSPTRPGTALQVRPSTKGSRLTSEGGGRLVRAEIPDPVVEAALATYKSMIPREVRVRVVAEAVLSERKAFFKRMEKYRAEVEIYNAQMPIEMLRLKLLADAGIASVPQLRAPPRPHMFALLSRGKLKAMVHRGMGLHREAQLETLAAAAATQVAAAAATAAARQAYLNS